MGSADKAGVEEEEEERIRTRCGQVEYGCRVVTRRDRQSIRGEEREGGECGEWW